VRALKREKTAGGGERGETGGAWGCGCVLYRLLSSRAGSVRDTLLALLCVAFIPVWVGMDGRVDNLAFNSATGRHGIGSWVHNRVHRSKSTPNDILGIAARKEAHPCLLLLSLELTKHSLDVALGTTKRGSSSHTHTYIQKTKSDYMRVSGIVR